MTEVKTHRDHPASMAERISKRLRNSGDTAHADVVVQKGSSPNRTFTNIHHSRVHTQGETNKGEGDINQRPRGPAAPVVGQLGEKQ
jgi:hypothetical protein